MQLPRGWWRWLRGSADQTQVDGWLQSEGHGFGWGYLSGEQGERADSAFAELKTALDIR